VPQSRGLAAEIWLLVGICLMTLSSLFRAMALEVEGDLGEAGAPSLGIYQVTYLSTAVNLDPNLTRGYQAIVDLQFSNAIRSSAGLLDGQPEPRQTPRMAGEAATFLGYAYTNMRQPRMRWHRCSRP